MIINKEVLFEEIIDRGISLNRTNLALLKFFKKFPYSSINFAAKSLKMDYHNAHRYYQEFKKGGFL